MRSVSATHVRARARQTFWLVPAGCVLVALALALGLPQLDVRLHTARVLFPGGPESARSFLSSVTTAMISITALVFSITIVALQLAAGQFSSRVMRDFLRDWTIQFTFGVFVATFTYAMVLQRSVRGTSDSSGFVPQVAVTAAFVFVLISVAIFILYINHIANAIRVANITARIGTETRAVIDARYPHTAGPDAPPAPAGPPDRIVASPDARPGVIVSINETALITLASRTHTVIALIPHTGNFLPVGAPLFAVYGEGLEDEQLLRHVAFDTERTYEQDALFGFRELVDIAERALSPAVNDPTTATQAIDILHDLLRRLATRPAPAGRHTDSEGNLRLIVPVHTFPDFLILALEEIQHYGAHDVQVPRRLRTMLTDLATVAMPAYQPLLRRRLRDLPDSADG